MKMIVPTKKPPLPVSRAARSRIGARISAAIKPIPWLIMFASSSLEECIRFDNARDGLKTFISEKMRKHALRDLEK